MNVAIIGSGISGLAAAWLLARRHDVTLFEADGRLGGHTCTVTVREGQRTHPLDIGFMVFNHHTYPNLTRLLTHLSIPTRAAEMSLSVTCQGCGLEYSGGSLRGLVAQPGNLARPAFWRLLSEILAFNRRATAALNDPGALEAEVSFGRLLARWGLDGQAARHYLYPMAAAIWSTGTGPIAEFPAHPIIQFMANHGLLGVTTHHQWYSVVGGAATYVHALAAPLGASVRTGVRVEAVERRRNHVRLHFADGGSQWFDGAIIATHADQALRLLADPDRDERELLGPWRYSSNRVVLHTDAAMLPSRRAAHAAWNVTQRACREPGNQVCVTYLLNRLQEVDSRQTYLVTLNPIAPPERGSIVLDTTMRHPIMTAESLATQGDLPRLNGGKRTWFCGAYHGWGFHEDGLTSAIRVAAELGETFP